MRRLISSGSRFEAEIGYSRAVVDGDHVWVSGTTGYDYKAMTIVDDVAGFQAAGGSLVMLAKGNRSKAVLNACKQYGGFYLGSVGGPAARLAQDCIRKVEVLEYPELGMEAVWKIEVEDFPAFIVVDDKGNDFYEGLE